LSCPSDFEEARMHKGGGKHFAGKSMALGGTGQESHKSLGDFKRILVGFDGSDHSTRAVHIACEFARKFLSKLIMINVYAPLVYGVPVSSVESFESDLEHEARNLVERAISIAKGEGVEATGETLMAQTAFQAITDYALANHVDLIILGTRGLTGLKKLTMGSVSSGVVAHAHCPVLVVR